jgi:hypothetical protein
MSLEYDIAPYCKGDFCTNLLTSSSDYKKKYCASCCDDLKMIKVAEGSTHGIEITQKGATIFITQLYTSSEDRWVRVHYDDIPALIRALGGVPKNEEA